VSIYRQANDEKGASDLFSTVFAYGPELTPEERGEIDSSVPPNIAQLGYLAD